MTDNSVDRIAFKSQLKQVLASFVELPQRDCESVLHLITAGEIEIALETLCTQIYEFDVSIDSAQQQILYQLGRRLGVPVGYLLGDPWELPPPSPDAL